MVLLTTTSQFELLRNNDLQQIIMATVFAILTGLGAFIAIPLSFTPIPITFQTFFVLLSGFVLGRKYGPLSQLIYVVLGIIGVPWFAGGTFGLSVLLGSSGGFLLGFIIASFVIGWITDISKQSRRPLALFTTAVIGSIIVYVFGVLGLLPYFPLLKSIELGIFPFIPGDLFKIILVFIVLYLFIPTTDLTFDTGPTPVKNNIWNGLLIFASFSVFTIFFAYLYSNGSNIPLYLPIISLFTSICLLSCLFLIARNFRNPQEQVSNKIKE